jgi:DNA repair protein RadC
MFIFMRGEEMKSYQQLGFEVNEDNKSHYIPKVQISMVKEVYVSNTAYRCSEDVAQSEIADNELRNSDREKFICVHFNVKNQIISYEVVSMGSLTSSIVHPREVFKAAILANAASVLFAHNHPSGSTEPSLDDIEITKRLCKAGSILGINVLDHLIITRNDYLSFAQKGLI